MDLDNETFNQQYAARKTWKALADFLGVSINTMVKRKEELKDAGAIFYMKRGRNTNPTVCWFPAVIMAYYIKKGAQRELF
jgi:hypothetical protein